MQRMVYESPNQELYVRFFGIPTPCGTRSRACELCLADVAAFPNILILVLSIESNTRSIAGGTFIIVNCPSVAKKTF